MNELILGNVRNYEGNWPEVDAIVQDINLEIKVLRHRGLDFSMSLKQLKIWRDTLKNLELKKYSKAAEHFKTLEYGEKVRAPESLINFFECKKLI